MNKISRREASKLFAYSSMSALILPSIISFKSSGMKKREIPSSGQSLAVIGLGTWQSFDVGNNLNDRKKLTEVLLNMKKLGGQLIDSSPMYGSSEKVVGDLTVESGLQDDFFYATKVWTDGKQSGIEQMKTSMKRMNRKTGEYVADIEGIKADGISNCVLPFLSSLPTCASFNRMWLMFSMGAKTRLAAVSSALFLLPLVLIFSDLIAIIPIPAMAAVIMIVGANMINWSDIRPHFSNWPEAVIFSSAFMSVHVFGLFGAVIVGSALALIYFKWHELHPEATLDDNVLRVRGSLYYGSLPFVEEKIKIFSNYDSPLCIDLRETSYIDAEGERWLEEMVRTRSAIIYRKSKSRDVDERRNGDRRKA